MPNCGLRVQGRQCTTRGIVAPTVTRPLPLAVVNNQKAIHLLYFPPLRFDLEVPRFEQRECGYVAI